MHNVYKSYLYIYGKLYSTNLSSETRRYATYAQRCNLDSHFQAEHLILCSPKLTRNGQPYRTPTTEQLIRLLGRHQSHLRVGRPVTSAVYGLAHLPKSIPSWLTQISSGRKPWLSHEISWIRFPHVVCLSTDRSFSSSRPKGNA